MNDKELLELAAKAAGIGPLDFEYANRDGHGFYFGPRLPMPQGVVMAAMHTYWNPLTDDGDALRLAVKLYERTGTFVMQIDRRGVLASGITTLLHEWESNRIVLLENDPYAATRRAIVRAAAEIGKAMNVE